MAANKIVIPAGGVAVAVASGTVGVVRCGAAVVAVLTTWRVVLSPTTQRPTLFADGPIRRYWVANPPTRLTAHLTPAPKPYRLGQKRAPTPTPFALTGTVHSLSATQLVLSGGEIHGIPE